MFYRTTCTALPKQEYDFRQKQELINIYFEQGKIKVSKVKAF